MDLDKQLAKDLWTAVSDGNEPEVKRLLESGANPNHCVYWSAEWPSLPPLHAACSDNRLSIAQVLVELGGAKINRGDKQYNKTPLHWAMEKLAQDTVAYLLKCGECDLSAEDNDGYSPVSTSLLSCYDNDLDPDMLVTVVRMAASHCSKDEKERLLFAICEQYHEFLDIVKLLVEECNFRLKGITDEEGQSPLTCVLSNMNEVILEEEADLILYLLEHGCDSSEETTKLLCVACSYGNLTLVKTLVEQFSIDPKDVQDEDGLTPLENGLEGLGTVYDKTMDVALYLLDRGFNDDTNRAKILCAACEYGDLDVVKKMIEEYKTEYKNVTNSSDVTLVDIADKNHQTEVHDYLKSLIHSSPTGEKRSLDYQDAEGLPKVKVMRVEEA